MKKKTLLLIIHGLFILLLSLNIQAQVIVNLQQPPPNQWHVEDMWQLTLTNTANQDYEVYLYATVEEANAGIIFEATSTSFTLEANYSGPVSHDDIEPADIDYPDAEYENIIKKTGSIPAGTYTICVYVKSVGGDDLGYDCKMQFITHPSPPELINPVDEATVTEELPVYLWLPPMPMSGFVTYNIKIVELLDGQTAIEAMEANPAWFEETGINSTSFQYPISARPFESGITYVWKVTAISDDDWVIGESSVWSFNYEAVAVVLYVEPVPIELISPSYGEVINTPTPRFEWEQIDTTAMATVTLTWTPTDTLTVTPTATLTATPEVSYNLIIWQLTEDLAEGYTLTEENLVDLDPYFVMDGIENTSFVYTDTIDYPLLPEFAYCWQVKAWTGDQLLGISEVCMFRFGLGLPWLFALSTYGVPGVTVDVNGNLIFDLTNWGKCQEKWEVMSKIDAIFSWLEKEIKDLEKMIKKVEDSKNVNDSKKVTAIKNARIKELQIEKKKYESALGEVKKEKDKADKKVQACNVPNNELKKAIDILKNTKIKIGDNSLLYKFLFATWSEINDAKRAVKKAVKKIQFQIMLNQPGSLPRLARNAEEAAKKAEEAAKKMMTAIEIWKLSGVNDKMLKIYKEQAAKAWDAAAKAWDAAGDAWLGSNNSDHVRKNQEAKRKAREARQKAQEARR